MNFVSSVKPVIVLVLLIWGCEEISRTEPPNIQGGGSETETLTGLVLAQDGRRLSGVRVKLLPSGYDPSLPSAEPIQVAATDDSGHFEFKGLDTTGFYNLIAGEPAKRMWAFAESLSTKPHRHSLTLTAAATYFLFLHSQAPYSGSDSGIAFFPGTDILARCDGLTAAQVDSVPAGLSRLVLRSRAGWQHLVDVPTNADSVHVNAGPASVSVRYLTH